MSQEQNDRLKILKLAASRSKIRVIKNPANLLRQEQQNAQITDSLPLGEELEAAVAVSEVHEEQSTALMVLDDALQASNINTLIGLVPTNPKVVALATRWGWKPETLIGKVERQLPNLYERRLWVMIGPEFRLQPNSIYRIIRAVFPHRELIESDFEDKIVGPNLRVNRIERLREFLNQVLAFIEKVDNEFGCYISITTALELIRLYGEEGAETMVASLAVDYEPGKKLSIAVFNLARDRQKRGSSGSGSTVPAVDSFMLGQDHDNLWRHGLDEALGEGDNFNE